MTMIKSEKEESVMLQYLLLTKSNYATWLIKMCVNLPSQCVWDAIEHGNDVEERKDRMTLSVIFQVAWEMLQIMHVDTECVKEAKVQTLKSEFEAIRMKDGESIDDFAMKLTIIISDIHSIGEKLEEISIVKKFL